MRDTECGTAVRRLDGGCGLVEELGVDWRWRNREGLTVPQGRRGETDGVRRPHDAHGHTLHAAVRYKHLPLLRSLVRTHGGDIARG